MLLEYIILCILLVYASCLEDEQPLTTTSLGKVLGHYKRSYGGCTFSAFEGIPYGKPPTGDLRFAEPQSVEPWTETWNATRVRKCIQPLWQPSQVDGDEDCLYLNVYVPKDLLKPGAELDVIVHIHGGAFMAGDPNLAGPEYLMDRNIVYVTINYRVGFLGFLSTEDEVVSGNNGLKDQVLALRWVQGNIEQFGGNPKSVTLIGMSAGGAAVHLHYFSLQSRGLFHRGIAQSGTALDPWVIQEASLERANKFALSVGCTSLLTKAFIKCMRQKPVKELLENVGKLYEFPGFPTALFSPVIEKPTKTAFLTDYPYTLLESGEVNDVPLIMSITTEEGIVGLLSMNNKLDQLNEHWDEALPSVLDYNYTANEADKPIIAEKIKQFYFGKENITDDDVQSFIKLFGDRHFALDFERSARMQAKVIKSPVYAYMYGYRGDHNFLSLFGLDKSYGVNHGEDGNLIYVVTIAGVVMKKDKLSESDEKMKNLLLDLVTSFAKDGTPKATNISWDPVTTSEEFGYLFFDKPDNVSMVFKQEIAPTSFWRSLPINEYQNKVIKCEL